MGRRFCKMLLVACLAAGSARPGRAGDDFLIHNKDGILETRIISDSAHQRTLVRYNQDGSVKNREVQELNGLGAPAKRTLYRADGSLDHMYEDYYSIRNYLSRTNAFDAKGELDEVRIYFDDNDVVTVLDGHGKFLRIESSYDPTIPRAVWATPYPGEFPDRSPTPKPPLQRFTDIHLSDPAK